MHGFPSVFQGILKLQLSVRVVKSPGPIPQGIHERIFAGHAKEFNYYEIAGRTLAGQFDHRYLILKNAATGATVVQPVFFADQDILDGLPPRIRAMLSSPRKLFPGWLKMRMLVVGCSAGDGTLDCVEPWFCGGLGEALAIYARRSKAPMILLKDFPKVYRDTLQPFVTGDYRRVPSMPACSLELDFASFEDYMKNKLGPKTPL